MQYFTFYSFLLYLLFVFFKYCFYSIFGSRYVQLGVVGVKHFKTILSSRSFCLGSPPALRRPRDRHAHKWRFVLVCWQLRKEKAKMQNWKLPRAGKSEVWQTDSQTVSLNSLWRWKVSTPTSTGPSPPPRSPSLPLSLLERQKPWQPWLFYAIQELVPQLIPASGRSSWFEGRFRWDDLSDQLQSTFDFCTILSQHALKAQRNCTKRKGDFWQKYWSYRALILHIIFSH